MLRRAVVSPNAGTEVEKRIAAWSLLPVENGEGLQVLRYQNGQKYEPHWVSSGLSLS